MYFSRFIALSSLSVIVLAGCQTVSDTVDKFHKPAAMPTFADSVRQSAQGQQANAAAKNTIAKEWEKGNSLVQDGNKKLTKGQDDIDAGNRKLDEGKRLMDEGHRDVEEGTRRMRDAESSFHTQFPDQSMPTPAATPAAAPTSPAHGS